MRGAPKQLSETPTESPSLSHTGRSRLPQRTAGPLTFYLRLWFLLTALLSLESFLLKRGAPYSFAAILKRHFGGLANLNLSPAPGRPISLVLGWTGIALLLATNLYILRKRIPAWRNWGNLARWLDAHIFFGLMGPVFILFHSNFQVRGLVAISFWSMIISMASGVVGRYFFVQISRQKEDYLKSSDHYLGHFHRVLAEKKIELTPEQIEKYKNIALHWVGADRDSKSLLPLVFSTLAKDIKMLFGAPPLPGKLGSRARAALHHFALNRRKSNYMDQYQQLMGYWHTFHAPFAIFMYGAAILHIIAALLFGVAK